VQRQAVLLEPLWQHRHDPFGIAFASTQDNGIVSKTVQCSVPFESWLNDILKPGIKDFMQEEV
jgi:hypothetical protein